eukprot:TRINITY_DN2972_c0_g1_i2.p1 TRINITY_DN2972_c0_g1~~TRINITY_DN2972_c0_g1_i2.p1  ORF type:complete len:190 (-),score=47.02 TRINITY_DN2972_c0_g1_i2:90-659(-)
METRNSSSITRAPVLAKTTFHTSRDCAALGCVRLARQSRQLCSKHARLHAKKKGKGGIPLKEGRCLGHVPRDPKKLKASPSPSAQILKIDVPSMTETMVEEQVYDTIKSYSKLDALAEAVMEAVKADFDLQPFESSPPLYSESVWIPIAQPIPIPTLIQQIPAISTPALKTLPPIRSYSSPLMLNPALN